MKLFSKKRLLLLFIIAIMSLSIIACGESEDDIVEDESAVIDEEMVDDEIINEEGQNIDELPEAMVLEMDLDEPMVLVNNRPILRKDFEDLLEMQKEMYENQYGFNFEDEQAKTMIPIIEEITLEQLIAQELIFSQAETLGVSVSEEEVNDRITSIKGQFEDEDQYEEALKNDGITEEELALSIKENLVFSKLIEQEIDLTENTVSEEEVLAYYEDYKKELESQGQEIPEFEEIAHLIEQQLLQEKETQLYGAYIEELKQESEIEYLF